jgi:hypothetical protein
MSLKPVFSRRASFILQCLGSGQRGHLGKVVIGPVAVVLSQEGDLVLRLIHLTLTVLV